VLSAWELARTDPGQAWRFLLSALESDVADVQGGTTAEGIIHLGAMAGRVEIVLSCLTGMRASGEGLRFDPALPAEVTHLRFSVHYRGHRVDVTLAEDHSCRPGGASPVKIFVCDEVRVLAPGTQAEFRFGRTPTVDAG